MSKHERLARLIKIMILVKAQRNLCRKDLARKCEVSVRTIQRDIDSLSYAGVPIFWCDDGYKIMPDFFLPPVNLSLEEAFHLVVATKSFSRGKDKLQQGIIESAISKIVARLPDGTRKHLLDILDSPALESEASMEARIESWARWKFSIAGTDSGSENFAFPA